MTVSRIGAIVLKDLREFSRNRFFVFITLLVLVAYVAVFWFLPNSVDETVKLGVSNSILSTDVGGVTEGGSAGFAIEIYASEEELQAAVEEGRDGIVAGIAFPPDFLESVAAGEAPTVRLLIPAGLPSEIQLLMESAVSEIAFGIAGEAPPVDPITEAIVLGTDRTGNQISLQQQMRPLILIMVLMVETFALSSLVAIEVQQRTAVAVLATPVRIVDFLAAKGIFGVGLAFSEVALLGLLIGAFAVNAPAVLVILLLGAVVVTGFGMIAGSYGRDFMGTLLVSMLFMIPLMIPAFGALFPGSAPGWVKVIPTYGLVEAIIRVTVDGDGWSQIAPVLLLLAAWGLAAFATGALILRRRVATL
ncbi:MAG: ABC transporter permease [Actinomycetota bacterium]